MKPILIELNDDTWAKFLEYKLHILPKADTVLLLNELVHAITIGHDIESDDFKVYNQLKKIHKELKYLRNTMTVYPEESDNCIRDPEDSDDCIRDPEDVSSKISLLSEQIDLQSRNYAELAAEIQRLKEVAEENGNVLDRCPCCGGEGEFTMIPAISTDTGCYTGSYKLEIQCKQCHHRVKHCCKEDQFEEGRQKLFRNCKKQKTMNAQGENDG